MFTLGTRGLVRGHRAQHINACRLGTGAYFSARILAWLPDKRCVHISALLGYCAREPSVNIALASAGPKLSASKNNCMSFT